MPTIQQILAREILDSRGFPTVEVELGLKENESGRKSRAMVPSGASTGEGEALELRDGDSKRFQGKGVQKAVQNIREKITPAIKGKSFQTQAELDRYLCQLDGTPNKSQLGANAILGVSMAFLRANAEAEKKQPYQQIGALFGSQARTLPVPLMNILNGGKHADNGLALQEFMIVPAGFQRFSDALRAGCEIFHQLKKILHKQGLSTGVGDEGGFAPQFKGSYPHEQALKAILTAVQEAGYEPGGNVFLALDSAASEFSRNKNQYEFEGQTLSSDQLIQIYEEWTRKYPIVSIEDGLAEHDWEGWTRITQKLANRCQLVGDDLFVTNSAFLRKGIEQKAANAILIKLNQIGTVTETLETMKLAQDAGYRSVTSHRSGETEDTFIADLAVGTDCGQIKTGSASRTDRVAKYNQLLRLEEALGNEAIFSGNKIFEKWKKAV